MLAFIGGTGVEGMGLAMRFAAVGEGILIGSRSIEKAEEATKALRAKIPRANVRGVENKEAAECGDLVFLTVPYKAQMHILESLKSALDSKILIHVVVPPIFEEGPTETEKIHLQRSAAEEAQKLVPNVKVVSALKDISAISLLESKSLDCDVITCSDHEDAKREVMRLVEKLDGVRALDGGPLRNSRSLEAITPLLLFLNKKYGVRTCLKIKGI